MASDSVVDCEGAGESGWGLGSMESALVSGGYSRR